MFMCASTYISTYLYLEVQSFCVYTVHISRYHTEYMVTRSNIL